MAHLTARVHHGRLILDVPVDLPEGTEVELVADDGRDGLTPEDRERLHAALEASSAEAERGEFIDADDVLARLPAE